MTHMITHMKASEIILRGPSIAEQRESLESVYGLLYFKPENDTKIVVNLVMKIKSIT